MHHLRAGNGQFTRLTRRGVGIQIHLVEQAQAGGRQRLADAARPVFPLIRIGAGHPGAFGKAIALHQLRPRGGYKAIAHRRRKGRPARNAGAQPREPRRPHTGKFRNGLKHCWHAGKNGGPHPADGGNNLGRIKAGKHGDASAIENGAVEHGGIGKNMKQRQRAQHHVALWRVAVAKGMRVYRHNLAGIGGDVLMGEHRPLGAARGAAGILDEGNIGFGINRHRLRLHRGKRVRPCGYRRIIGQR